VTTPLYTQCRGCGEIFAINTETLTCAYGRVRCCVCGTVFNALDTLSDRLGDGDLPLHDTENAPPLLQHPEEAEPAQPPHTAAPALASETRCDAIATPDNSAQSQHSPVTNEELLSSIASAPAATQPATTSAVASDTDEDEALPVFETITKPAPSGSWSTAWTLATLVLLGAFFWQTTEGIRHGIITLPDAPWSHWLCDKLECSAEQATPVALDHIASISSNIRPHPGREDALVVSTTFMNTAKKAMPFPALQVTLSDLNGKTVAMRRFLPREYLPANLQNGQMLPQTLIPVSLEILRPNAQANAFQIDFSQPGGASEHD